jgi:Flp pilus assembly protein TadD
LNPLSPAIHYEYGCLLISLKQDTKAMSHLKRAIELRPDDAMAHNRLSELYEKNNQMDKAWFHIRIARHLAPENVEISKAFQKLHKNFR